MKPPSDGRGSPAPGEFYMDVGTGETPGKHARVTIIAEKEHPFYHCSCLCLLPSGNIFAAWHAGANEKQKSLSIQGAILDISSNKWSKPRVIANTENRTDCDPVLLLDPETGLLWLFHQTMHHGKLLGDRYKTGYSLCNIKYRVSGDGGESWSDWRFLRRLWGWVIRSKAVVLPDGSWLLPMHREIFQYQAMFYKSVDKGHSWYRVGRLAAPKGCLEPSVVAFPDGELLACMRTRNGFTYQARSFDQGEHWTEPESTGLLNPSSAVDVCLFDEETVLLAFNNSQKARAPLTLAATNDRGKSWHVLGDIVSEKTGQFSYPSMVVDREGDLHVSFSWHRTGIAHARIPRKSVEELLHS